jgi:hypothetical protein
LTGKIDTSSTFSRVGAVISKEGAHLKKLRRAEEGAKIFGVFRVKNHDFTPKKIIFFSNFRGRAPGAPTWIRLWARAHKSYFTTIKKSCPTTKGVL